MRIVVIDAEKAVREALQRVLSGSAEVVTAADVGQGLALLRDAPVDLVIVDVVTRDAAGIGAIREIRRDHPHIAVIALAGSGAEGVDSYRPHAISTAAYLAASTAAGANGTLAKPFETGELKELIARVCSPPPGP